jgi:hypothetical protein
VPRNGSRQITFKEAPTNSTYRNITLAVDVAWLRQCPVMTSKGTFSADSLDSESVRYNPDAYAGWSAERIVSELRRFTSRVLLRGRVQTLIARREIGGLLAALAAGNRSREDFEGLAFAATGLRYPDARRHIQLWVNWPRVADVLSGMVDDARRRGIPFHVPGYQKLLDVAVVRHSPASQMTMVPLGPPQVLAEPLPTDVRQLQALLGDLQADNRELRAELAKVKVQLSVARDAYDFQQEEINAMRRRTRAEPVCSPVIAVSPEQ